MPKCRKGKVSENKAGRRYEKAGYGVKYRKKFRFGEVDLIAKRGREKIAAEVKHGNKTRTILTSEVKKIAKKARHLRAKPAIILTGRARLSSNARKAARKLRVKVKKI